MRAMTREKKGKANATANEKAMHTTVVAIQTARPKPAAVAGSASFRWNSAGSDRCSSE